MTRTPFLCALCCAIGCTPGSFAVGSGVGATAGARTVTVDVNLTRDPAGTSPFGAAGGYAPLEAVLTVGDFVRFTNSDGFAHTATAIAAAAFPAAYPFDASALAPRGTTLSGGFGSGSLAPGASSPALLADRTGTYLYGCFYHYGSPMRAALEVR